ncbi:MAG: hypothetical protein JNL28_04025 [Planctomycetes bacterium]|nr:hypothetical protein [Planctomycetota bacterium]
MPIPVYALCLLALLAQSPPDLPPPPPLPEAAGGTTPVQNLVPGVLPEGTTPAARERWQKILTASLPGESERAPVTAFDLSIDLQYRASSAQTNDLPSARYQWLAPGYVRADTGRSRVHLRGPKGSYLIDESRSDRVEIVSLDVGRDNILERRKLDEEAAVASNFARLTDPHSIRMRRLTELAGAPKILPEALKEAAKRLAWLELESPDFYVMRPSSQQGAEMARVTLGVDVITNRVELVLLDDAGAPPALTASTAALRLKNYKAVDGFQVPFEIAIWLPEQPPAEQRAALVQWMSREAMVMWLKKAALRPALKPEDFLPPTPTPPK